MDYKQYDSRWGKTMYSSRNNPSDTIRSSGCGPTALANIVATWYDQNITPVQTCAMAVTNGFRTASSGTSRAFFAWAAAKYKCSKFIKTYSTDEVIAALKKGALVVALLGPGYWTGGGHYITCWKYDAANDRIYANDPGSSTRKYSSAKIFREQRKEYFIFFK
jgi:hypothetical protein